MDSYGFRILKYLFDKGTYPDSSGINIAPLLKQIYNELYDGNNTEQIINVNIRDNIMKPLVNSEYAQFSGWKDLGVGKRGTNPDYMNTVKKSNIINGVLLQAGYNFVIEKNKESESNQPRALQPGVPLLETCPFTLARVDATRGDNFLEYQLTFHSNIYKLRLASVDWSNRKELNDTNRWIFQGMFYNNEWPIEEDTIITPQLVSHIIRLGDYPRNFQEKSDYFLLKSASAGGSEFKSVKYSDDNYYDAYAESISEFLRLLNGLVVRKYIEINSQGQWFTFEENGILHAEELSKKEPDVVTPIGNGQKIVIGIINTKKDEAEAEKLRQFFLKKGVTVNMYETLTGDSQESTFNLEQSIERGELHYIIFVKSHNSETNGSYIRVQTLAEKFHKTNLSQHDCLFFAGIEDGPYNFPMAAIFYDRCLYDFRITTNRNRLINAIYNDWNNRINAVSQIIEETRRKRVFDFPLIYLSENDKIWMEGVYERFCKNEEEYFGDIKPKYWEILPKDYDPSKIDRVLLDNGSNITFYGLWRIHPETDLLECIEKSIFSLKAILIREGNKRDFTATEISAEAGIAIDKMLSALTLLNRFGGFINIHQTSDKDAKFRIVNEGGLDKINDFDSLEKSLREKYPSLWQDNVSLPPSNLKVKKNLNDEIDSNDKDSHSSQINIKDRGLSAVMGVQELAQDVVAIIDELSYEQDQMIGIFGRWGRGKTFFINELKSALKSHKEIRYNVAEYKAWKYQETPASWAYLYEIFTEAYYDKPKELSLTKYVEYCGRVINLNLERNGIVPFLKFGFSLLLSVSASIGLYAWSNISALIGIPVVVATWYAFLRKMLHEYSHSAYSLIHKYVVPHTYENTMGLQAEIQKEIIKLFKVWIPGVKQGSREKIVLIVEDIDRCYEDKILQNIASLRVMLEDPEILNRLIIITAIDDSILKNAIRTQYEKLIRDVDKDSIELNRIIAEYLDKVFLFAIKLGTLSTKNKEEFIDELLKHEIGKPVANSIGATDPQDLADGDGSNVEETETLPNKGESDFLPDENKTEVDSGNKKLSNVAQGEELSELTTQEALIIKAVMLDWKNSTPRRMRIFYYRYLLCKTLLFKRYTTSNIWQNKEGIKLLLNVMVKYVDINDSIQIGIDKAEIEAVNEDKANIKRIDYPFTINKIDYLNLLEVLEMVIAY